MPGRSSDGLPDSVSPPSAFAAFNSTSFLGLKLYIVVLFTLAALSCASVLILLCLRRIIRGKQGSGSRVLLKQTSRKTPLVSKHAEDGRLGGAKPIEEVAIMVGGGGKGSGGSDRSRSSSSASVVSAEVQNVGWGRWYGLKELEAATRGFSAENVVGEGGFGIVYRGVLEDGSVVAVKNLLNNRGQAEKEFEGEVEAIGRVRHKNLVGLIGYCAEGATRMLVYEYVENGNLGHWLHGEVGDVSPLTWDIRVKIAIGTAKGLAHLHEGLEPKVVHRDVKSSNILLDRNWNAKVSDFGLAKLLGSEASYVTTRVMGTFGYVSPEYASTGMLSEGSDVYSFGVLLMELVTGRSPVDYSRPPGEMNLVDWFKGRIANHRGEGLLDRRIEVQPSPRALKRMLLVCLRCVDMDAFKRPKMGQIVHMLEADEFPFRSEHRPQSETGPPLPHPPSHTRATSKALCAPKGILAVEVQRPMGWGR